MNLARKATMLLDGIGRVQSLGPAYIKEQVLRFKIQSAQASTREI